VESISNVTFHYNSRIKEIEPNAPLDVRDTEQIWCKGIVLKIVTYPKKPQLLLIHYEVLLGEI